MSRGAAAPRGKEKAPAKRRGLGAGSRTRTGDLRITSASLYQLSYTSTTKTKALFLRISTK